MRSSFRSSSLAPLCHGEALTCWSWSRTEVYVIPSRTWSSAAVPGGAPGSVDGQPSLLGLSLRLCSPQHALDQVRNLLRLADLSSWSQAFS